MFMLPLVPPAALYRDPAMKNPNNDKKHEEQSKPWP
jgi:hypothetical protein